MFLLPPDYYEIRKTKKKGRGVFARKHIPAGTIIGDYLGKIVSDAEVTKLEKKFGESCYSFEYEREGVSVFPVNIKAPGVHLINHSCGPNCDVASHEGHNIYFALRHIFPGEELTFDYNFDPESQGVNSICFCDSPFCRGTMNARVDKPNLRGEVIIEAEEKKTKPKYRVYKVGELLPKLDKYPKDIKDASKFDIFANLRVPALDVPGNKLPTLKEVRERLRLTGRRLKFKEIGLTVLAMIDNCLIITR